MNQIKICNHNIPSYHTVLEICLFKKGTRHKTAEVMLMPKSSNDTFNDATIINPTQFSSSGQRRRFCADRYCRRGTIALPDSSSRFSRGSQVALLYPFQRIKYCRCRFRILWLVTASTMYRICPSRTVIGGGGGRVRPGMEFSV